MDRHWRRAAALKYCRRAWARTHAKPSRHGTPCSSEASPAPLEGGTAVRPTRRSRTPSATPLVRRAISKLKLTVTCSAVFCCSRNGTIPAQGRVSRQPLPAWRRRGGRLHFDTAIAAAEYDLQLGERLHERAHFESASALLSEAEAAWAGGERPPRLIAMWGTIHLALGDVERAIGDLTSAYFSYRRTPARHLLARAFIAGHMAGAFANRGQFERARLWAGWSERTQKPAALGMTIRHACCRLC